MQSYVNKMKIGRKRYVEIERNRNRKVALENAFTVVNRRIIVDEVNQVKQERERVREREESYAAAYNYKIKQIELYIHIYTRITTEY